MVDELTTETFCDALYNCATQDGFKVAIMFDDLKSLNEFMSAINTYLPDGAERLKGCDVSVLHSTNSLCRTQIVFSNRSRIKAVLSPVCFDGGDIYDAILFHEDIQTSHITRAFHLLKPHHKKWIKSNLVTEDVPTAWLDTTELDNFINQFESADA